ncbi:MAG: hypothetical protein ICV84_23285 [Flavisolibacter sp.]|nr:hypothetical protein [Flavisolibacter sp.]
MMDSILHLKFFSTTKEKKVNSSGNRRLYELVEVVDELFFTIGGHSDARKDC